MVNGFVPELARLRHAELVAEAREHARAHIAVPRRVRASGRSAVRARLMLLMAAVVLSAALLLSKTLTAWHLLGTALVVAGFGLPPARRHTTDSPQGCSS